MLLLLASIAALDPGWLGGTWGGQAPATRPPALFSKNTLTESVSLCLAGV